jgi:hypothetical protein
MKTFSLEEKREITRVLGAKIVQEASAEELAKLGELFDPVNGNGQVLAQQRFIKIRALQEKR